MADCNETIRELDAFLDGELPDEVRAHIHVHLESCMDCLQAFDFQAELKRAIRRKCGSGSSEPVLVVPEMPTMHIGRTPADRSRAMACSSASIRMRNSSSVGSTRTASRPAPTASTALSTATCRSCDV